MAKSEAELFEAFTIMAATVPRTRLTAAMEKYCDENDVPTHTIVMEVADPTPLHIVHGTPATGSFTWIENPNR